MRSNATSEICSIRLRAGAAGLYDDNDEVAECDPEWEWVIGAGVEVEVVVVVGSSGEPGREEVGRRMYSPLERNHRRIHSGGEGIVAGKERPWPPWDIGGSDEDDGDMVGMEQRQRMNHSVARRGYVRCAVDEECVASRGMCGVLSGGFPQVFAAPCRGWRVFRCRHE
jgi:hypothetical protein